MQKIKNSDEGRYVVTPISSASQLKPNLLPAEEVYSKMANNPGQSIADYQTIDDETKGDAHYSAMHD